MIDSHCHFDFAEFDHNRLESWQRCQALGLRALLVPGVSAMQWPGAQLLCEQIRGLYFTAGLHPWWLSRELSRESRQGAANPLPGALSELWRTDFSAQLQQRLTHPRCIAIGECGLDKPHIGQSGLDPKIGWQQQLAVFELQLDLAQRLNMPIILHVVQAHAEMLSLLKTAKLGSGGVIHAFSGSADIAKQYWQLGFRLGVGGTITYARAQKTRKALQSLPLEAMLLETDAPAMPLAGKQGVANTPEHLPLIAAALADLKQVAVERVVEQTSQNFCELFDVRV